MATIHDAGVLDLQGGGRVGIAQSWVGACAVAHFAHASRRPCGGKQGHGESETFLLGSGCGLQVQDGNASRCYPGQETHPHLWLLDRARDES
jgi:hypothetical protein